MRTLHSLCLLALASLVLGAAPSQPPRAAGADSVVFLLDISRPIEVALVELMPEATDGLVFYFLVLQARPTEAIFIIQETRDFKFETGSYSERTTAELGAPLEPQMIVEDIPDFFASVRPDLQKHQALVRGREGIVVYGLVSGGRLVTGEGGTVSGHFGWGPEVQQFDFAFSVPPKR
jgi:hypothetical protein